MIAEAFDFAAEVDALYEVLASQPHSVWGLRTQFKDWTINDVVLHLYASDALCIASLQSAGAYRALRAEIADRRKGGRSMIEESRGRYPGLSGRHLLETWAAQAKEVANALAQRDGKDRLVWSGPPMSARMMAIARQMETWAHGQEVHDRLGLDRPAETRLHNVAEIGVKTYGWTFANRGRDVPGPPPRVVLAAPDGTSWTWNVQIDTPDMVAGPAVDFCQVVTQVRNVADTRLRVFGPCAADWMSIAQCFAGPPSDPPAPGTRRPVVNESSDRTRTDQDNGNGRS